MDIENKQDRPVITREMLDAGMQVLSDADWWGRGAIGTDDLRRALEAMLSAGGLVLAPHPEAGIDDKQRSVMS